MGRGGSAKKSSRRRGAQERLSEKMDDTRKEPLELSKPENSWHEKGEAPMNGAEAVETENSWHEKGEAPVDAGEAAEIDPASDKAPELKEIGSKKEKKKKKNKQKNAA